MVLASRSLEKLEKVGIPGAKCVPVDLSKEFTPLGAEMGNLGVMVNNAGVLI